MRRYFDIPLHSYNSSYNSSCCVLCLSFFFLWRRGRGPTCTPSPLRTRVSRSLKVKSNKLTQPRWSTPPQDGFSPLRPTRTEAELEMLFREIRGAHHKRRFLHEALVAAWGPPPPREKSRLEISRGRPSGREAGDYSCSGRRETSRTNAIQHRGFGFAMQTRTHTFPSRLPD